MPSTTEMVATPLVYGALGAGLVLARGGMRDFKVKPLGVNLFNLPGVIVGAAAGVGTGLLVDLVHKYHDDNVPAAQRWGSRDALLLDGAAGGAAAWLLFNAINPKSSAVLGDFSIIAVGATSAIVGDYVVSVINSVV